jgi:hypothetical protein
MVFGSDFDNTIVSYKGVFHSIAVEQGLIPESLPITKDAVRDYLRKQGKEDDWTEMQGLVYGSRMDAAQPYQGVEGFFKFCKESKIPVRIISHKTRYPFIGKRHDLHQAASRWLETRGFLAPGTVGIAKDNVYFELTKEAKMQRIQASGCTHFIDDLPDFLLHPGFPKGVVRWLFDPSGSHQEMDGVRRFSNWDEVRAEVANAHQTTQL